PTTFAPSAPHLVAIAAPMPPPPPVSTTTLPASRSAIEAGADLVPERLVGASHAAVRRELRDDLAVHAHALDLGGRGDLGGEDAGVGLVQRGHDLAVQRLAAIDHREEREHLQVLEA